MPYGYLGVKPNQKVRNAGILDVTDHSILAKEGHIQGGMDLIQSQTVSDVSSVAFTNIYEDKYSVHYLQIYNYKPAESGTDYIGIRFYESGTLESSNVYKRVGQYGYYSGSFGENKSTGSYYMSTGIESATTQDAGGHLYIYNAGNSSSYTFTTAQANNDSYSWYSSGVLPQASVVDGIYLYNADSGTSENLSLTAKLYGIR